MITKPYRLTHEARELRVANLTAAHREAEKLDLEWFDFERWEWTSQKWIPVSSWNWDSQSRRFVATCALEAK